MDGAAGHRGLRGALVKPGTALIGLGAILLVLASLVGIDSCKRHKGQQNEVTAAAHVGAAQVHEARASEAEKALPEVQAKLQQTQEGLDRARAEVARLRRQVATQAGTGVPDPPSPDPAPAQPLPPDHRDQLLVAQGKLIEEQDKKITLQAEALRLALIRGDEYKAQAVDERKARMAQEAATAAWKSAVTTSRWRGRIEGFAAGLALGYVGGKR